MNWGVPKVDWSRMKIAPPLLATKQVELEGLQQILEEPQPSISSDDSTPLVEESTSEVTNDHPENVKRQHSVYNTVTKAINSQTVAAAAIGGGIGAVIAGPMGAVAGKHAYFF